MPAIAAPIAPATPAAASEAAEETYTSFADAVAGGAGLPPDNAPAVKAEPIKPAEPVAEVKPEPKPEPKPVAAEIAAKPEPNPKTDQADNPNLEPVPAKAPEKPVVADFEADKKGMTTRARANFEKLEAIAKTATAERDAAATEIAEIKSRLEEAGKNGPEIERLRKELDDTRARLSEYEGEIAIGRVESTRQFKAQVTEPQAEIAGTISAIAKKYEVAESAIMDAIREPDAAKRGDAIEELAADFKGYDRNELFEAAKAYVRTQKIAADMRGNAKAKLDELTKQSQQETEAMAVANITEYRTAAQREWKAIQEKHPLLRPAEGKPEWNEYLAGIQREVEAINVNDLPVADVARMKAESRALPEVVKALAYFQSTLTKRDAELAAANERLGEYRKTEPGAGEGTNGSGSATENRSEGFLDAVLPP